MDYYNSYSEREYKRYNSGVMNAKVNARYTIKIINDTPVDQFVIWTAKSYKEDIPTWEVTNPIKIYPGHTLQHSFDSTLYEAIHVAELIPDGRWCLFQFKPEFQDRTLPLSWILLYINEQKQRNSNICMHFKAWPIR